jgi:AmmeMemoRadiSam system protein A
MEATRGLMSEILGLARQAVAHYVETGETFAPPAPLLRELGLPGAAFVTLRIRTALRGCIGTLIATRPTLAEEIVANAIAAASKDPRFAPVTSGELAALSYEVDLLGSLSEVSDESELDPAQYGVVVESGDRRGVLLPAVEGVTSVQQQIVIARKKARIAPDEPLRLYRFSVLRFKDTP